MKRRDVVMALVFAGIVISYIDRGNLSIAAPSIMQDFQITPRAMGVLLSAFFWTYGAFQLPAGAVVDKLGIRAAYACGFLVWSLASAGMALTRGTGDVIGLRLLLGVAESIGPLASLAFIRANFEGKEQGLPTSIYIAGQSIGPALGAFGGTLLLAKFGWRAMFAITGLGALVWLPGWLAAAPRRTVAREETPQAFEWAAVLKIPHLAVLAGCIFLASYFWYFVLTWLPGYLVLARGFSSVQMGRVISSALLTMAVTNVMSGFAADRFASRWGVFRTRVMFAAAGYAGTAVILLLPVVVDRRWILPVLTFSICATGTGNSSFWTIAQYISPVRMAGRTIGLLNTMSQVAGAVAPVVTGWIAGPKNHFGPAIVVAGCCPLLAGGCLLSVWLRSAQRENCIGIGKL